MLEKLKMNTLILIGVQIAASIWEMWMCYQLLLSTVIEDKYRTKRDQMIMVGTFTVSYTHLTLPCEMKDLEAIGFQLDTGDTSAEYMVNPAEYELAFFNDQYGHSIMFDMINETDAALKIVECKDGGIYIDE